MLKKMFVVTGALALITGAAWAGPACCQPTAKAAKSESKAKPKAKLTEVSVCPMMQAPVTGKGSGSSIVGSYKVNFCCAGCKPGFDKLSKEDKQKKIQEALKKQNAAKKNSSKKA